MGSSPTGGTLLGVAVFPLYCSRRRVQGEARLALIFLARCVIWNCYSLWLLAPSGSLCGVLRGVEALVRVLGRLRRASPRGARTARLALVFGRYGGRAVLRGFCGGAIFLLSWMCPWLVARLWGACFLASWTVRVVFSYAFSRE